MDKAETKGGRNAPPPAGRRGAVGGDFVGRGEERARFEQWLASAAQGEGRVVAVAGEAGIGKTRLLQELLAQARCGGAVVLAGRCAEGAEGGAYAPFREALDGYVSEVGDETLRTQLGASAGVIAPLVPPLRARLADLAEPVRLQPDEERTRLLDAVNQFLIAIAARAPLVLALDDLHWADDDTLALFRYLGRNVGRQRMLLLGAYREGEVEEEGTLAQTLAVLRRQPGFERVALTGLARAEVETLLRALAEQRATAWSAGPVDAALTEAIGNDTKGNPFFVCSLVLHLEEEGRLRVEEGCWRATVPLDEVALPEGVRQVLRRRLSRLTEATQALLTVAAAVGGAFRFDVVAAVTELKGEQALAAIDEALQAQLIEPTSALDSYAFVHALVRQTLYEVNPSRQVRLHRQIAEAMEATFVERAMEHATEIATHYHRSRTLPHARRGVPYCLEAAQQAIARIAYAEAAAQLRAASDLLPADAPEQLHIRAQLGLALVSALRFDEAAAVAREVARRIAVEQSADAAATYLADVVRVLFEVGGFPQIQSLVPQGLEFAANRRDETWATFKIFEIRALETDEGNGIPLDTPERRELADVLERASGPMRKMFYFRRLTSQAAIVASDPEPARFFPVGDYRGGIRILRHALSDPAYEGRIGIAIGMWSDISRWHVALGEFERAQEARQTAIAFAQRSLDPSDHTAQLVSGEDEWRLARDDQWDEPMQHLGPGMGSEETSGRYRVAISAAMGRTHAHVGRTENAMHCLASILDALELAPAWMENYPRITCDAAATLWLCRRTEGIDIIERNLRTKVIEPDFHHPMMDGRLALARLCALQERYDEALEWFAKARIVLDGQGARPLRAIVDHDEALMYARRNDGGDRERAQPLLDAALAQFRAVGMPGWIRRAEALSNELAKQSATGLQALPTSLPTVAVPSVRARFREEGEFWTVAFSGTTVRLKTGRGMQFLSVLLRAPGVEISSSELVDRAAQATASAPSNGAAAQDLAGLTVGGLGDAGEQLDAPARASYKQRLGELREELDEAERFHDSGRSERLQTEIEFLIRELSRAVGLGGRERRARSHAERARVNATRVIALALRKITAQHPALGAHLVRTVKTGTFCSYNPDPRAPIEWEI